MRFRITGINAVKAFITAGYLAAILGKLIVGTGQLQSLLPFMNDYPILCDALQNAVCLLVAMGLYEVSPYLGLTIDYRSRYLGNGQLVRTDRHGLPTFVRVQKWPIIVGALAFNVLLGLAKAWIHKYYGLTMPFAYDLVWWAFVLALWSGAEFLSFREVRLGRRLHSGEKVISPRMGDVYVKVSTNHKNEFVRYPLTKELAAHLMLLKLKEHGMLPFYNVK